MMNCILWNCRGANKPNFRRSIRYILKKFKTDILAVLRRMREVSEQSVSAKGWGLISRFVWMQWDRVVGYGSYGSRR